MENCETSVETLHCKLNGVDTISLKYSTIATTLNHMFFATKVKIYCVQTWLMKYKLTVAVIYWIIVYEMTIVVVSK